MICEFTHRDGTGRAGKLQLQDETTIMLPAVCDPEVLFPDLKKRAYSYISPFADEAFYNKFHSFDGMPVPLHIQSKYEGRSGDTFIAENWHVLIKNPAKFIEYLVNLKERYKPDSVWFIPGTALPENAAILVHTGFDLFDYTAVDLLSSQGKFCLSDGTHSGNLIMSGLCSCEGCKTGDLKLHNRLALEHELALITARIKEGTFREFIDSRCRNKPEYVSIMRHLDRTEFMLRHTPANRANVMYACSGDSIHRPEVKRFAERLITRYTPPSTDVAVLIPCSAKKPYSLSRSHQKFIQAIGRRAHELIMTSPLGLVPRDLELCYPASHYDVPVTGYWDHEERYVIKEILVKYFSKHHYKRVIAHLDGDAYLIAKDACDEVGIELESTGGDDNLTGNEALSRLSQALNGEKKLKNHMLKGMISFQFGYDLNATGMEIKGSYPNMVVQKNRRQFFTTDPAHGLLRPTFDGWSLIETGYRVYIDNFIPKGDVLAPGVSGADPAILEGDEVYIIGDLAVATGRAVMSADEMEKSTRGVAVKLRKVKKL